MKRTSIPSVFLVICCLFLFLPPSQSCDTWIALKSATRNGQMIMTKNSDRTVFDCQPLLLYARKSWESGAVIDLGRLSIPQVAETYAVIGSSPYWCWGFEEGMNEFGVAIGNEGIFTKSLVEEIRSKQSGQSQPYGPTGMDILRLALERSQTAEEAVRIIGEMTELYGQFGSGMPMMDFNGAYHNSYMVSDPTEAWIVETTGKHWVARRIAEDVASISNTFCIEEHWDLGSEGVKRNAARKSWWNESSTFNFSKAYSNDGAAYVAQQQRAETRANCSLGLLEQKKSNIDVPWMMRIARDRSTNPSLDLDVTASSCIAVLPSDNASVPVFWWAASVPGVSCYVPYFVQSGKLPVMVSKAGTLGKTVTPPRKVGMDQFSEESLWWLFRDLADMANLDWDVRSKIIRAEFDPLELEFVAEAQRVSRDAAEMIKTGKGEDASKYLAGFTQLCFDQMLVKLQALRTRFSDEQPDLDPTTFGEYVGTFELQPGMTFAITLEEEQVFAHLTGQPKFPVYPVFKDRFEFRVAPAAIQFERDSEGIVTGLVLHQGGQEIPARKTGG